MSSMYDSPRLSASTLRASTSTPTTSWPCSVALTLQRHPAYAARVATSALCVRQDEEAVRGGPPNHELFAGRVHCSPDRWLVHPLDTLKTTFWYHPNATGWKQEARLLAADDRVPKRDP